MEFVVVSLASEENVNDVPTDFSVSVNFRSLVHRMQVHAHRDQCADGATLNVCHQLLQGTGSGCSVTYVEDRSLTFPRAWFTKCAKPWTQPGCRSPTVTGMRLVCHEVVSNCVRTFRIVRRA